MSAGSEMTLNNDPMPNMSPHKLPVSGAVGGVWSEPLPNMENLMAWFCSRG